MGVSNCVFENILNMIFSEYEKTSFWRHVKELDFTCFYKQTSCSPVWLGNSCRLMPFQQVTVDRALQKRDKKNELGQNTCSALTQVQSKSAEVHPLSPGVSPAGMSPWCWEGRIGGAARPRRGAFGMGSWPVVSMDLLSRSVLIICWTCFVCCWCRWQSHLGLVLKWTKSFEANSEHGAKQTCANSLCFKFIFECSY